MKYLIFAFFLILSGCGDPVNKTISEFKKNNLSKVLNDCGGLNGKFTYKVVKFNQLKLVDDIDSPLNDELVLVVEIVKELIKDKPIQINNIYRFNDQTFVFKKKSFYFDQKNDRFWKKDELKDYSFNDFCNDKIPQIKISSQPVSNEIKMELLISKFAAIVSKGIGMEEFQRLVDSEEILYVAEGEGGIGNMKFCMRNSQLGFIMNYLPTGAGTVDELIPIENCKNN
jgi:hypothetical protein